MQPIFGYVPLCYLHIKSLPVSNSSWCSSHPRSTLIYYRRFPNMFYLLVVQHSSDKNPVMTPISSLGPTHSNSRNLSCTSCLEGALDVKNKQTFPQFPHCARTPVGSTPNTYVTIVRRKDSTQENFGRHVEAYLQKRVDASNAHSQRHPSNSAARKMAGWFDWNFLGRALSSRLQQNMVGWLRCNFCKTRRTLLTVKFDTRVNMPCANTSFG